MCDLWDILIDLEGTVGADFDEEVCMFGRLPHHVSIITPRLPSVTAKV